MSTITQIIEAHRPKLEQYEDLYKHLHQNAELSFVESETAKTISSRLDSLNVPHKKHIGGHGLAGIVENGKGPTVLLRADFDGLPVEEKTGLPYASTKRIKDKEGKEQPAMHACGHDMHVTSLLAATELLLSAKNEWSGTLILLFQPAEEKGAGARAMVEDGLYEKHAVPKPDVAFGAHVMPLKAGHIEMKAGTFASACDAFKVTIYGRGGHASQPHRTIDPVVIAASIVTRLQSVVAREVSPIEPAVVTVASIHAGETENVIAAQAEMKINIRTYTEKARATVLAAVKRIIQAECDAGATPKPPEYQVISDYPLTNNDDQVTQRLGEAMQAHFGDKVNLEGGYLGGSEDFPHLANAVGAPYCYYAYGGGDPDVWDKHEKDGTLNELPINHSAFFAPVIQPTLTAAVDGYATAALAWLRKS